jgi:hypothetical protein
MFSHLADSPGGRTLGLVLQLLEIGGASPAVAVPVLWVVLIAAAMAIACQPPQGC